VNMVLGAWLFVSAFIWPHTEASQLNTWICGLLVFLIALLAYRIPSVRWLNAALGLWMVISGFVLPHITIATMWNNVIVGLLIMLIALGGLSRPVPQSPIP